MAMRNPNGYGSVYKMSGKRRKPWAVVKTISLTAGKQERALLGTFATRAEANEFLVKFNRNPYDLKTENLTFYEVFELFYEHQTSKVSKGTLKNYQSNIKFFEKIFKKSFRDLNLLVLQTLFDESDLNAATLKNRRGLLTSLFSFAIKRNLIDKNIASNIEINKKKEISVERKIFTEEEIKVLWEQINDLNREDVSMILIMIYTSLRIGELLELEKVNVHLEEEIPYIDVIKSKTEAGIRIIPIHDKILPVIEEFYNSNNRYLFENNGKKNQYTNWKINHFDKVIENLNLQRHTPHDCRHTFVTRLSMTNANPVAIRTIVGHTGKNLTENVYTHFPLEELKKAIDLLN